MLEEYRKILDGLHEGPDQPARNLNDHILIVDGLNTFLRSFAVVKMINPRGHNVGGVYGFLKSLASLVRQFNPTRVIVAWDGLGGATNRKYLNPNYKAQREHTSVVHWDLYDTKEEESESIHSQAERIVDYLACLPVTYVQVPKVEADDIIAYLAQKASQSDHMVTIVSMDKDFMQLIDKNIRVYSPVRKTLFDYEEAVKFLGVLPENYNIVKALQGDKSDNLRGVKGVGVKTLVKVIPGLQSDPNLTLDQVFDKCSSLLETKKVCTNIIAEWKLVESNFQLMDLHQSVLDESEKSIIAKRISEPITKVYAAPFIAMLEEDCIDGLSSDVESWLKMNFSGLLLE